MSVSRVENYGEVGGGAVPNEAIRFLHRHYHDDVALERWLDRPERFVFDLQRWLWKAGKESEGILITPTANRVPPGVVVAERDLRPFWGGAPLKYHCVCLVGGRVHDPNLPAVLPLDAWCTLAFPGGQPVEFGAIQEVPR
jgi:hypothetical protein